MKKSHITSLLSLNLLNEWQRINADLINQLCEGFLSWQPATDKARKDLNDAEIIVLLIPYLQYVVAEELNSIDQLQHAFQVFSKHYTHSSNTTEKHAHILSFSKVLGASKLQLASDQKALKQHLDRDAIVDRYQKKLQSHERLVVFVLQRLAQLITALFAQPNINKLETWQRLKLHTFLPTILSGDYEERLAVAALDFLLQSIKALPEPLLADAIDDQLLHFINRAALETNRDTQLQRHAISILAKLAPGQLPQLFQLRLSTPATLSSDFFVRCHIVEQLCLHSHGLDNLSQFINDVLKDPSAHVRQRLAENLHALPLDSFSHCFATLLQQDLSSAVRCATLLSLNTFSDIKTIELAMACLPDYIVKESHTDVLRCLTHVLPCIHQKLIQLPSHTTSETTKHIISVWRLNSRLILSQLHENAESSAVRRAAAQATEELWLQEDQLRLRTFSALQERINLQNANSTIKIPRNDNFDDDTVARLLSQIAQNDQSLDVDIKKKYLRIRKGHRFGLRLWRVIHEFRNPATDKRQAFQHWTGRIFFGLHHFPSAIMAERSPTTVPGEPRVFNDELGWRPWLPLVDELISALDQDWPTKPVKIYTPEGITEILPPAGLWQRLKARMQLTWRFTHFAKLRNWDHQNGQSPQDYSEAIQALGFKLKQQPYGDDEPEAENKYRGQDFRVQQFFPVVIFPIGGQLWLQMENYFFSVYQNTLTHLIWFLVIMGCFFVARHITLSIIFRQLRKKIPLVIGGWGSRGKSGTERLKSALFNALGLSIMSKTTGCEAMMIHSHRHGKLRELGLFRPYDKATIWEQMNVVKMAVQLKSDVFLWECMGLTPSFIKILQQQWMRDDIATITNCYPDHEDLQGPAGINIPEVMCHFIPPNATLFTSEIEMLPVLRESARQRNTQLISIPWLSQALVCEDVIDHFPYEEHPSNIALVLSIANHLEVERDFALQAMAEYVVADIGVLNCFPYAQFNGRHLQFINGLSANERFATMENWRRMDFDKIAEDDPADIWLTTIINNRADRVSRSKVFAQLIAEELTVDRHFLVGSNLDGMANYIEEAWQTHMASFSLWGQQQQTPLEALLIACKRMRIPTQPQQLQDRLRLMLKAVRQDDDEEKINSLSLCWHDIEKLNTGLSAWLQEQEVINSALLAAKHEDIKTFAALQLTEYKALQNLVTQIEQCQSKADEVNMDKACLKQLWQWFSARIITVENSHPHQLLNSISQHSPIGVKTRIMGLQNIKGPGLGFVYMWRSWETFYQQTELVINGRQVERKKALNELSLLSDFNPLCEEHGATWLAEAHNLQSTQNEQAQAQLAVIAATLNNSKANRQNTHTTEQHSRVFKTIVNHVEAFLDAGHAVKRRKRADKVYRLLAAEQLSHEKASTLISAINSEQSGGWLLKRLQR